MSLPNTSFKSKVILVYAIVANTAGNMLVKYWKPSYKVKSRTKHLQTSVNKVPLNTVESFLNDAARAFTLCKIHNIINSSNGFANVPSLHVTALIVMNYIWQNFINTKG